MRTEREKMLAGELYDPLDPELVARRGPGPRPVPGPQRHPRGATQDERRRILASCSARAATRSGCSRRSSATTARTSCSASGSSSTSTASCSTCAGCTIGDFTLFGPAVQIYTATHPMNAELRRKQEFGKPIEIGSDVWVGGGAIICPGVTIGVADGHRRRQRGHARHPGRACSRPATRAGSSGRSPSKGHERGERRRAIPSPMTWLTVPFVVSLGTRRAVASRASPPCLA